MLIASGPPSARAAARLLNDRIDGAYQEGLEALRQRPEVVVIAKGGRQPDGATTPSLLRTTVGRLVSDAAHLLTECFGPVSLVVEYEDESQLIEVADLLEGQLTATVHGELDDPIAPGLLDKLADRAGRIVWNSWPTTLSVTWAIHHGGPYPATTSPLHTSVGATAIGRFLRPVAYQGVPDPLLPAALQEANPLHLPRRVDGEYQGAWTSSDTFVSGARMPSGRHCDRPVSGREIAGDRLRDEQR